MDSDGACYMMLCLFRVYQMKLVHNARYIKGLLFYTVTTKSKVCLSVISYSSLHK